MISLKQIKEELDNCKRPLFFFHDDTDGLASFLLLYRYKQEGRGVVVKYSTGLDETFVRKVDEYQPDKVFITDFPQMEDVFKEKVKVPIVWIDHHPLTDDLDYSGIKYYNPRIKTPDKNIPATKICYEIVKQDLWLAATGVVGDWVFIPSFMKKVNKEFPKLLPKKIKSPDKALFESKFGKLSRIFEFVLKGKISDVNKCVKVLSRIKTPEEILDQSTPEGKFIFKRYKLSVAPYEKLLSLAKKEVSKDKMLVFSYKTEGESFTGDLANELLYLHSDKVVIIAREKSGDMRCSLRSPPSISVREMLEKSLVGIEGSGGGHPQSCGCSVKVEQWDDFLDNMKNALAEQTGNSGKK